jgi:adenylate cyclase
MSAESFKRKLTAILSADVVGYGRLMGDDEVATVSTMKSRRNLIAEKIQAFKGRVIDSPGDNLLAEFSSIVDAVTCAVEIQNELKEKNAELPEERRMLFRMGVNLGDVIQDEDRIYGDGVNIAARIESMADPGGVSISGTAFDSVRNKLKFGFEFLGEHQVKNIAHPVRVYRLLTDPAYSGKLIAKEQGKPFKIPRTLTAVAVVIFLIGAIYFYLANIASRETATTKRTAPAEASKASIAVLPFDNMSDDPDQAYFGDGICEDLITDLTKIPDLLVISRLSSFTYKGKSAKVQQIGQELGVRYVLEGSVRKANNNVRINAQLIDAATGHHLWAERYDGNASDIFALQDKITQKIAASLALKLTEDDRGRLLQKGTKNMEAYEAYLKGSAIANTLRNDPEKFVESLPWFEKAVELDSEFSRAYAEMAQTYIFGRNFGIQRKLGISSRLASIRGTNYLQMAMKNPANVAYRTAALVYTNQRQYEKAIDYGMKAIALGPTEYRSNAFMAQSLIWAGKPDEALAYTEMMRRADPACLW